MNDGAELRFDDGKDPAALRTIGEVASAFGIKQHVLRYWEQQFPMLRPLKRSGGRRYYRPEDVALVETIDRLINREGYTLKGARQAIEKGQGGAIAAPPAAMGRVASAELGVLPQLRAIRNRLAAALAA
jgi:DNA-binding transcriptional MerR regulator